MLVGSEAKAFEHCLGAAVPRLQSMGGSDIFFSLGTAAAQRKYAAAQIRATALFQSHQSRSQDHSEWHRAAAGEMGHSCRQRGSRRARLSGRAACMRDAGPQGLTPVRTDGAVEVVRWLEA